MDKLSILNDGTNRFNGSEYSITYKVFSTKKLQAQFSHKETITLLSVELCLPQNLPVQGLR